MQTHVSIGQNLHYELKEALLIYGSKQEHFITHHAVQMEQGNAPTLGPAQPLTVSFVERLARSLLGAAPIELLPERVVAVGHQSIVWWSKPVRRQMFYKSADHGCDALNGRVFPQPALVWRVSHGELKVRALLESKRPTAQTKLAVAPFWNLSGDGRVCTGSMRRPSRVSVAGIDAWEQAFYESAFTHANAGRLTRHEGGFEGLWTELVGRKRFPSETLIPLPETVADFTGARR